MKMLPLHRQFIPLVETLICAGLFVSGPVKAGDVFKDNNANNLTDPLSWVGGLAAPTAPDVGVWDSTVTAANTTVLGADASWGGIRIANPGGLVTINAGNTLTLGSSGATLSAQSLTLNNAVTVGAAQNWNVASGYTLTAAGAVAINNPLTVNGSGTVSLSAANTGSGGVTLSSGTLSLGNANSAGVSTTLTANGGTLALGADTASTINLIFGGPVLISIGGNRVVGGNSSTPTIGGNGYLTFSGLSSGRTFTFAASMAGFTGTVDLGANNGAFRFNSGGGNYARGNVGATFNLGTGTGSLNNRNGGNLTYDLGALIGGSGTTLSGRSSGSGATSSTYSIGALGTDTIFAGTIQNGGDNNGVNIVKVGAGKLTLSGTSTYSGTTMINAGTLQVDGNLNGAGIVTVGALGTLQGIGKITGSTTVNGQVAPGDSIGTLTFNNGLTLAGLTTMEIDRNASQNADLLNVLGTLTCGGTLTVVNDGANLLQGDSFNLFDGTIAASTFAAINLPSLSDPGLEWDLSQLYTTGIISVQEIPEPATFALLGIGGLLTAWQIRRRKV